MAYFTWLSTVEDLSPAALTVMAQTLSPNDGGRLKWDIFFPRENVDSVDLDNVTALDDRPAADRREWNARGRRVPMLIPERQKISIIPIEASDSIMEKELQKLAENTLGNTAIIERIIGAKIPDRARRLAESVYRRHEIDAMSAWANGTVIQRNPEDASKTVTMSFGFDTARITTAATAWNDSGISGYDAFLTWVQAGVDAVGSISGVALRQATLNAILADAPDLANGVTMTRAGLVQRIQDDLGSDFSFFLMEDSVDVFTDGGTAVTRTKVWPAQKVAIGPAGGQVGKSAFAPVMRAMEMANQVPGAGVDMRGVTVYYEESNGGRQLDIEAQANPLAIPDENKLFVIDAGV